MWSPEQERALAKVSNWLKNDEQQCFRLFGYAGTGKTTLAKALASDLDDRDVLFAAFTGKAAHVLQTKGCPATTIHSLIYRSRDKGTAAIKLIESELAKLLDELSQDGATQAQIMEHKKVKDLQAMLAQERKNVEQPSFSLNVDSKVRDAKLVIIDECSMVDSRMGEDLLSFGTKVLVLGDPAQLPPVKGEGFFTNATPDVMLQEIHRQAADNPIIHMATTVRTGGRLTVGQYGESKVIERHHLNAEMAMGADQILVGKNLTRHNYNRRLRQLNNFEGDLPNPGERLVCLRNDHDVGLLNGSLWHSKTCQRMDNDTCLLDLEADGRELSVEAHTHYFEGREQELSYWNKKEAQEFAYGYALTCHKAQGSQWDDVLVIDESSVFRQDAAKWLYTALTRAAIRVTVAL